VDIGSTNMTELRRTNGGTSYWDYWSEEVPWDSSNHQWRDEAGQWHPFETELLRELRDRTMRHMSWWTGRDRE